MVSSSIQPDDARHVAVLLHQAFCSSTSAPNPQHVLQEAFHQRGVKVPATLVCHRTDRVILRHPFAVNARLQHGVKRIGNGHDARGKRDVLPREAGRIAAAVEMLVMMARDAGCQLQDRVGRPSKQIGTDVGVPLHDLVLCVGQGGGLEQDVIRNAQLADVVHGRHKIDVPLFRVVQLQNVCQIRRNSGRPDEMAQGRRIARPAGKREAGENDVGAALLCHGVDLLGRAPVGTQ